MSAGHEMGRPRLPCPDTMDVPQSVQPPMKPSVLYNQTTV
jgi:hypothetical protein